MRRLADGRERIGGRKEKGKRRETEKAAREKGVEKRRKMRGNGAGAGPCRRGRADIYDAPLFA